VLFRSLSEDAQETSGLGLKGSLTAAWLPRMNEAWRLELRAAALFTDYGGARYDDVAGSFAFGARRVFDRGYWGPAATYDRRWYGGDKFYDAWGVRLNGARRLTPRLLGFGAVSASLYDYTIEDGRDGYVATLSGGLSYALSSASLTSARLSVSREEADDAARANTSYAFQLSYTREYANALTVSVTPFAAVRPFDGFSPLFGATRRDVRYGAAVDALNREWSYRGFSPAVVYTFSRNESNVVIYDYTRHQLELRLTRSF